MRWLAGTVSPRWGEEWGWGGRGMIPWGKVYEVQEVEAFRWDLVQTWTCSIGCILTLTLVFIRVQYATYVVRTYKAVLLFLRFFIFQITRVRWKLFSDVKAGPRNCFWPLDMEYSSRLCIRHNWSGLNESPLIWVCVSRSYRQLSD